MKRKLIYAAGLIALCLIAGIVWNKNASVTRIALVNFQPYILTSIKMANPSKFVLIDEVSVDNLHRLKRYDLVIGFGMGLRIGVEQRAIIDQYIAQGLPMFFYAATAPENRISTLDSIQQKAVEDYLSNGNKRNYANLALYVRKHIDQKNWFAPSPEDPVESVTDVLFHIDENAYFRTVSEYEMYLKQNGFYHVGGPKIAMVGGMNDPFGGNRANIDSIISSFQSAGMNIYPVASFRKRLEFLKEIGPDAVLYFPHGRMVMGQADLAVEWLKNRNIPLFAPLTILQNQSDWEKDRMGMFGGFMSQSVMMPELDGAIYPYVLTAQEIDKNGLYHFKAIPDRLKSFTQIVSNFIKLKNVSNAEKKVAIYYFKGAGQETLTAQGLETVPSLFNLLRRLKSEGYKVDNLPENVKDFEKMIMQQGVVLSPYVAGSLDDFLKFGSPALVEKSEYESWVQKAIPASLYRQVVDTYGEASGGYLSVKEEGRSYLAVARVQFGNIVLLPQPMAALGDDAFAIVHGANSPPPHAYIASYLWSRFAFKADAMIHFGTHGSLEFTPQKQVALSSFDWPDRLVGTVPHFYYYSIGNVGESVMAKRRSYATTISYLTPPFMESNTRGQFVNLQKAINTYFSHLSADTETAINAAEPSAKLRAASLEVKKIAVEMGLHRYLRLDSVLNIPYSQDEIIRIGNFAEEISNEKINGELYVTGVPFSSEKIHSTVMAMSADPIAYSLANLDRLRSKVTQQQLNNKVFFSQRYLNPAKVIVSQILSGKIPDQNMVTRIADITKEELEDSRVITAPVRRGPAQEPRNVYTKSQREFARSVMEIERTLLNVLANRNALQKSPEAELAALLNGLSGGYVAPGPGGDAVANPNAVPTGRNLYSINAESTPTELAWEKGVALAKATLNQYKRKHKDYPRKISYTFWSAEFIESEGATIAQVLYMLGVEPVRDGFGRVSDLRLIESADLGRPRIDVVVQTSGQFRDIAASRLALITQAVELAASAKDIQFENQVTSSTVQIEKLLVEQGLSPKIAREMSTQRVFGGINGMYGTNIQGMITSGDKWENENEIAETYIHNMGAVYGGDKNWGQFQEGLLRAVLHNTDLLVQPRQNNTWGALSLDHVYEFMGGMNLAIRSVTGKDPEAYFADYRNRNNFRMQDLKEAIGVEARATIFNPEYIRQVMKGAASSAAQIVEVATNTYAWNVTKPSVIDNEMWDEMYDVYIKDKFKFGVREFFERVNPAALQEMTAVMLETVRKGMWSASEEQQHNIATLHADLVKKFGPAGSGFAGENAKLQNFIATKLNAQSAKEYKDQIQNMGMSGEQRGVVLKKNNSTHEHINAQDDNTDPIWIIGVVLAIVILVLIAIRIKRKDFMNK